MDFTEQTYRDLLASLKKRGYTFKPFLDYKNDGKADSTIILRHDVDRLPENALMMAEMESELGIRGTFYFRVVPESFDVEIIKSIALLGHEIGYHYEDVDLALQKIKDESKKIKGDEGQSAERKARRGRGSEGETGRLSEGEMEGGSEKESGEKIHGARTSVRYHKPIPIVDDVPPGLIDMAWESFKSNLAKIREIYPVKTICMHGSPLSKYDNRLLWSKYDYHSLGITAAAYYDTPWDEFAYFTDTGRRWNGESVSIRDKVNSAHNFNFRTTYDIISNVDKLPPKIMFTVHPERWSDNLVVWTKQLVGQNLKNVVKWILVRS